MYTQRYALNGKFLGVTLLGEIGVSDDLQIPEAPGNRDWEEFLVWNAAQTPPLSLDDIPSTVRKKRSIYEIQADIDLLTGAQLTAVWNDLNAGTPPKIALDEGTNAAAIYTMHFVATGIGGLTATEKNEARQRVITFYVQDNPNYLVNPPFDPTINIPGDELE